MRIDPLTAAGLAIAIGSGAMSQLNPQRAAVTTTAAATDAAAVTLGIESDAAAAMAEQAEQRYLSGLCFVAVHPIAPGQVVQETTPPGSFACDRWGTTAAIAPSGELVNIARTGEQSIIIEGIK
jgi:hypothetical protein